MGDLLDIGCGNGAFLAAAKATGYRVYGIDFDRESVRFARERRGLLTVEALSIDCYSAAAERDGRSFDIITSFEVLEHQVDPTGFLRQVARLLRPGGTFVGTVPNRNRLRWANFEDSDFPPHHFLRWSDKSLRTALSKVGLQPLRIRTENLDNWVGALSRSIAEPFKQPRFDCARESAPSAPQSTFTQFQPGLGRKLVLLARDAMVWPLKIGARSLGWGENLYFEAVRLSD